MPYYIETQPGGIEAWSTERLPVDPKGWQSEMRDGIRRALLRLDQSDKLYARYSSYVRDRCDAENVLFYNVGTSRFDRLSQRRIVFERSFETAGNVWPHHTLYSTNGVRPVWRRGEDRAAFQAELAPEDRPPPRLDASFAWAALKRAMGIATSGRLDGTYGLSVTLYAPRGARLVLASALKGLFAGVIAAFHVHDGRDLDKVAGRLATILDHDPRLVSRLLTDGREAVLGQRRLLSPFGTHGVQWHPADDLCVAGELTREDSAGGWGVTGALYEVEAA